MFTWLAFHNRENNAKCFDVLKWNAFWEFKFTVEPVFTTTFCSSDFGRKWQVVLKYRLLRNEKVLFGVIHFATNDSGR